MSVAVAPSLRVAGVDAEELAGRFGTPLYVYDFDGVERQVADLRAALPTSVDIAFAVKANPALAVLALLSGLGLGADVASGGELAAARRAGIGPDRIVMTGPGKRDDELLAAIRAGVRAVTVESPGELARLEAIAADEGAVVPVLLRLESTIGSGAEQVRIIGDGGAGKFGMDPDDALEAGRRALASPHLDLLGIHSFGASNVLDADRLIEHATETVEATSRLAANIGASLRLVDIGGGLGIPYEVGERPLDLQRFGRGLGRLVATMGADPWLAGARVLLEPGRFLVGPAGTYLTRVIDRKRVAGSTVVVVDGGIHHLVRPALVGQPHRIVGVAATGAGLESVTVAGPLCTGLDILGQRIRLPAPAVGDLLGVLDVGAYGFTESMPLFLSHPTPAEVAIRRGEVALIRPPLDPGSWLDRQVVPEW